MVICRTRPEDAVLLLDLFVSDAGIIGNSAGASAPQFFEHFTRRAKRKTALAAHRGGNVLDDPPILPRISGWIDRTIDLDHATFNLRNGSFIFLVQRTRQHDIGVTSRFIEKEVD